MSNILNKKQVVEVLATVVICVFFVAIFIYASTTIGNNVSTGGTLTVTGAISASSTLQVTGATRLYSTLTVDGLSALSNATTTLLTVSNNTFLGDADADTLTIRAGTWSLTSTATSTAAMTNGLNFDSNTFVIDPNSNRVGVLTATPAYSFQVNGTFAAATTTLTSGAALTLGSMVSDPSSASNGMMYYDSNLNVIRVYQNSSWGSLNAANGWTDNGVTVYPTTMADQFLIGTTTVSGLSQLTLEATSTAAIPLTIRGYSGQTADLLRIHNVAGTELFSIDALGNASSTMISTTGNIWVNGFATTTGSNGNFATEGTLGVTGLTTLVNATNTLLTVLNGAYFGDADADTLTIRAGVWSLTSTATTTAAMTNGLNFDSNTFVIDPNTNKIGVGTSTPNIAGLIFGTCTVTIGSVTASSTAVANCTAFGVTTAYQVFVTPYITNAHIIFTSASSTANDTIQIAVYNTGVTGDVNPADNTWAWMAIR